MSAEYIVKRRGSIVFGPCGEREALDAAQGMNDDYQSDEYWVEPWVVAA